ncbi:MAG: TetR/AcrR family transcriptional regulator [Oscillospiraceae bacterium]|nr:TetR/AcrR family transcriptional regulator [Oscillospiraceae bacterium]
MDRRQRKTREAIFSAFIGLLSEKEFGQITVGEIIEKADVGRATFYAHFETKDFLLKELCEELFCHILDASGKESCGHSHIFACDAPDSVFLHLFQHLLKNDNNILLLLSGQNNELFLQYFQEKLRQLVVDHLPQFAQRKNRCLPESFWIDHIASTFVQTLRWWLANGMAESPQTITEYFYMAV